MFDYPIVNMLKLTIRVELSQLCQRKIKDCEQFMVDIIVVQGMIFILRLHLQNWETKTTLCYMPALDSIGNSCNETF